MSKHPMSFKAWRQLREDIADGFEGILGTIDKLNPITFSDKRDAAEKARDAVLKALYEADAIEPPKGTDPS